MRSALKVDVRGTRDRDVRPTLLLYGLGAVALLSIFDGVVVVSSLPFLRNPAGLVALLLFALYVWYRRGGVLVYGGAYRWALALLLFTAILEVLRGVATGVPDWARYMQWAQVFVLMLITIDLARDRRALGIVWGGVVVGIVIMAVFSIFGLLGLAKVHEARQGFSGINLNRQGYWHVLAMISITWVLLRMWPRFGAIGVGLFIATGVLITAMLQTGSRGALVALAIGVTTTLVLSLRRRNLVAYVTLGPLILTLAAWQLSETPVIRERVERTFTAQDFGARDTLLENAWTLVRASPWVGYGPAFAARIGEARGMNRAISSHNSLMQVVLSFGIGGLILWLGIVSSVVWRNWHLRASPRGALMLGLLAASLAYGLVADLGFNKYFWILLGIGAQTPATGSGDLVVRSVAPHATGARDASALPGDVESPTVSPYRPCPSLEP
jgi:O-antigen ligase